ncbi:MAG: plasmid pRiA4b ORF-3 family protein, partial [Chthoniobacterales bacterium]
KTGHLCQIKVTLKWSKPPIWRRILVPGNLSLEGLHFVIQTAMGWTNSHLHDFVTGPQPGATIYGMLDPEDTWSTRNILDERRYKVTDLLERDQARALYEYDFGDGWLHELLREKTLPPDPGFRYPVCLAGRGDCPPEDCGGIYGYYRLLEILADPKHEEYRDMREWAGGWLQHGRFDRRETNEILRSLRA